MFTTQILARLFHSGTSIWSLREIFLDLQLALVVVFRHIRYISILNHESDEAQSIFRATIEVEFYPFFRMKRHSLTPTGRAASTAYTI